MAIQQREWLDVIEREYLRDFIPSGGAAIKFAVGEGNSIETLLGERDGLAVLASEFAVRAMQHGLLLVGIDAAQAKLHMIQDVFFAIARAVDWERLAQVYVEKLFAQNGYEWPKPGEAVPLDSLADANGVDRLILGRDVKRWLTQSLMRDVRMAQDFRVAMTQLCLRRMAPADEHLGVIAPVVEWLRGELRPISALKQTQITSKITRHNGRAMLRSLCRWLRLCGHRGVCLTLDIRQLSRTNGLLGSGLRYTAATVIDGFEVLRQLIDDAESFEGLFILVLADQAFISGDPKRSVDAYTALKMRVWSDVHARGGDNPLAPLVQISSTPEAAK
jgi:hypothetical protein